jgi:steroid delta-isomerase-like uncharacterized protein
MADENIAVMRRWFEQGWNEGREEIISELFAEDGIAHGLGEAGIDVRGPADYLPFYHRLRGAFPNIRITIEDWISEGEKIALRWTVSVTHTGDDLGIAATGRDATATGMTFCIIRDGKIVHAWNNWDAAGLIEQLATPEERAACHILE